ncbi:uncharacterized protein LOC114518742 [Dendronephthya gigantea]|uniref:uncharacterized protein LOC114518742 n=1 Tax=Dendronephthya gigantea TaxID=151771 RepID=UPI00106C6126|nr:uncharacterized protein LOC114518742 [Dendronephthya gigantea]
MKLLLCGPHTGCNQTEISRQLMLSKQTVSNITNKFLERGTLIPGRGIKPRSVSLPEVVEFVEYTKITKPSTYAAEIQSEMLNLGVCAADKVPSRTTISRILNKDLNFTFKKLSPIPAESLTMPNLARTLDYVMFMSGADPSKVHFFDESSVTKTTPNRTYGHAKRGEKALEVQRYSSNCNYTVNLLHSRFGGDYFNILEGPSNGLEMLHFFDECLQLVDDVYGNPVLSDGDMVVMDNCGFHHAAMAENELRTMLANRGVHLIFQPPYSPDFNTCEFCFRNMKLFLRQHEQYAINFTELAIMEGLQTVTPEVSHKFFQHCGFNI